MYGCQSALGAALDAGHMRHAVQVCSHDNDPHKKIIRRENKKTILRALDEYRVTATYWKDPI